MSDIDQVTAESLAKVITKDLMDALEYMIESRVTLVITKALECIRHNEKVDE